jgi:hypothetical protein
MSEAGTFNLLNARNVQKAALTLQDGKQDGDSSRVIALAIIDGDQVRVGSSPMLFTRAMSSRAFRFPSCLFRFGRSKWRARYMIGQIKFHRKSQTV